jgi:hypothetical protein
MLIAIYNASHNVQLVKLLQITLHAGLHATTTKLFKNFPPIKRVGCKWKRFYWNIIFFCSLSFCNKIKLKYEAIDFSLHMRIFSAMS